MRHKKTIKKLSRRESHRKSLMRNLAKDLFKYEAIQTTLEKAKAVRPFAEKLITKSKKNTVHSKRLVARDIVEREVLIKLFDDIALRYQNRPGGYTRIYRLGKRGNDGAERAIIELVPELLK
jgi:large subunit ribosomal protein L17